jgi:hypothetical protein
MGQTLSPTFQLVLSTIYIFKIITHESKVDGQKTASLNLFV